jgi:hypothetical protein
MESWMALGAAEDLPGIILIIIQMERWFTPFKIIGFIM